MAFFASVCDINYVTYLVQRGVYLAEIARQYRELYPYSRGNSRRSVRRFCSLNGITRLTNDDIYKLVSNIVTVYGHTYGRKMTHGSINAQLDVTSDAVSQRRVAKALHQVEPRAYQARARDLVVRTNPVPYKAPYFGYKSHFDQNEKLAQSYGCTFVDGCSRLIAGFASMPVKNPILIYEFVFRPALITYGIWDQISMNNGTEICLTIFVQKILAYYRGNKERAPFMQTPSTQNYVAERIWPEINSRVNYPIKLAMNDFVERNNIDLSDPVMKHCISWVTMHVSKSGVEHFVHAWNHHRIPGPKGCVPIENMNSTIRIQHIDEGIIPTVSEAVIMYEANGGVLTRDPTFGFDPLLRRYDLIESRKALFDRNSVEASIIFSNTVHGDSQLLQQTLLIYYDLTQQLIENI